MQRSETRILTTHTGSLPRPKSLVDFQLRMSRGEAIDSAALAAMVEQATHYVIAQQLACGVDIGNDGEQPRESFFTYVRYRMSGFGGESQRAPLQDSEIRIGFWRAQTAGLILQRGSGRSLKRWCGRSYGRYVQGQN